MIKTLRKEIKEYYNTYFFLVLSGSYKGCKINFYSLDGSKPIEQIIINAFETMDYVQTNDMSKMLSRVKGAEKLIETLKHGYNESLEDPKAHKSSLTQ